MIKKNEPRYGSVNINELKKTEFAMMKVYQDECRKMN